MERGGDSEGEKLKGVPLTLSDSQIFRNPLILQMYNKYQMQKKSTQDEKLTSEAISRSYACQHTRPIIYQRRKPSISKKATLKVNSPRGYCPTSLSTLGKSKKTYQATAPTPDEYFRDPFGVWTPPNKQKDIELFLN